MTDETVQTGVSEPVTPVENPEPGQPGTQKDDYLQPGVTQPGIQPGETAGNKDEQGKENTQPAETPGDASPRTKIDLTVDNNKGKLQTADQIINNEIKQYFVGDEKRIRIKRFSIDDSFPINRECLGELQHTFVYPEAHLSTLVEKLEKWRLLLITGDEHSGKYETAQYVSIKLMQTRQSQQDIRYIEPLAREVNIDLPELIRESLELEQKILVFKNSFAKNNPGLVDFFSTCSRAALEFFAERLKEIDAYLIFTADNNTFKQYEYPISNLPFKENISVLDENLLKLGMEKKIKQVYHLRSQPDLENALQFLDREKDKIIRHLKRMSRIVVFIEQYLEKILDNEKTIDDAIVEVNDTGRRLEHWFLKELTGDKRNFEVWTFTLCLAVFNRSRYADFYEIHREVTQLLLKHFDPFKTYEQFAYTLSESQLLRRCHAHITKDIVTYSDAVEFIGHQYREELMDILLKNNRNVLLFIVPLLKDYVEKHHRFTQRRFAAISLGRIGVIDPESITLPVIDRWAEMDENIKRVNVGFLYEGIISSGDPVYISICMQKLKQMALGVKIDRQWTAIAAYKQIGFHDLDVAMNELRYIQEEIIARMFKKQTVLDFIYSQSSQLDELGVLAILDGIYEETDYLLSTVRYSIVALSVVLDPIDVLEKLKIWIHEGDANTRINVVLFCMGNDGVFKELEGREVIYADKENSGGKDERKSNPLLFSLTGVDDRIQKMAGFLGELYSTCLSEFKMEVKKGFKSLLFNHFQQWAVESLSNSKTAEAVKKLLLEFYTSGDNELKTSLWDYMGRWKAGEDNRQQLKEFIDDLTKRFFK